MLIKKHIMRKISLLFIVCMNFIFFDTAFSQSAAITKIIQNGQRIELTVSASKPFYVGGNIHILHIGKKDFSLSKQNNSDGKGIIIFYIPVEEFNTLTEGDYIWMSYGNKFKKIPDPTSDPAKFCKKNSKKCWALGKFSKQLTGN